MLNSEKRIYKICGVTPILGSSPASKDIRTAYIASRAPNPADVEGEEEYVPNLDDKGLTVFLRDDVDYKDGKRDALMLLDYQVRGFLKASLSNRSAFNGIKQARAKVDRYVFVHPRKVPIMRRKERIYEEDSICERPLRATTMKGDRVALAGSEMIDTPWEIMIQVELLPNEGSKLSRSVTWEAIEDALDYGALCGIGQFRNGGYGRFVWKRMVELEKTEGKA